MTITIDILPEFKRFVPARRLRAAALAVLTHENQQGDVTVLVTDDDAIADLNRRFLGDDGPTDVLSFPAQSDDDQGFVSPPDARPYLGDVIIAYPYAAHQADKQGHPVAAELELLVVHGVLHLLGYDHAEASGQTEMWARQETILATLRDA